MHSGTVSDLPNKKHINRGTELKTRQNYYSASKHLHVTPFADEAHFVFAIVTIRRSNYMQMMKNISCI